ncbi:TonB-dependent receptor plug domain-containing protein [Robiginitalea biformata]|uniref:TonB-dependent receptor plug domain-containing protein n=1 Tax=Robiginitalea biformata TaxID=252307 RepID=UPI003B5A65B0
MIPFRKSCRGQAIAWLLLLAWGAAAQSGSPKKITICWDASASMEGNEPVYAFRYLEPVLASCADCEVELVTIGTSAVKNSYVVQDGDWTELKKDLEAITYDGIAPYALFNEHLQPGATYIYTDGVQLHPNDRLLLEKGNTILSRSTGEAQQFLERTALVYRGNYIQLKPLARAIRPGAGNPETRETGTGFGQGVIALEEVEVNETRREAAEKVRTGTGTRDSRRVGVAVSSLDDEDVSEIQTDISQSLQGGRLTGVNVGPGQDATQFTSRTNLTMLGNNYGLVVVDGTPLAQSNSSGGGAGSQRANFIDPANIADITVLKGLAATNMYGEAGRNGVLLITTKNAVYGTADNRQNADALQLRNNVYDARETTGPTGSAISRSLSGIPVAPAYRRYLELRKSRDADPGFYLDASAAFRDRDPVLSSRIVSNLAERMSDRPAAVSAALYGLLASGSHEAAIVVAESLASVPSPAGSALVSRALLAKDKQEKAALVRQLIKAHRQVQGTGEAAREYRTFLQREIQNLFRANPEFAGMIPGAYDYENCPTYRARLVIEWNLPGAEFNLQSVNPQQRFYDWEHSQLAAPERLREEHQTGYTVKTFDFYGADSSGEWLFNVELLSDPPSPDNLPLVFGCRIYENFGMASQTVSYQTVHLGRVGEKQQLLRLFVK